MALPDSWWDGRLSLYGIAWLDLLQVKNDGNNQWSGNCGCVVMGSYSVREMRFWICVGPYWWYHGRRLFEGRCFCFLSTFFRIISILTDWILKITGQDRYHSSLTYYLQAARERPAKFIHWGLLFGVRQFFGSRGRTSFSDSSCKD